MHYFDLFWSKYDAHHVPQMHTLIEREWRGKRGFNAPHLIWSVKYFVLTGISCHAGMGWEWQVRIVCRHKRHTRMMSERSFVCSKPSQRAGRIGHMVWYLMIWIQFLSLKMLFYLQMLMFVQERPSSKYASSSSNLRKLIDESMNLSLEKDWHVRRQTKRAIVMVHAAKAMEHNMTVKRQFAQLNM